MTTATQITPKQSEQPSTSATPDLASLKIRQQAAWSSGNYAIVGTTLQIVGEELCEARDLRSASKVLDVAAGNGKGFIGQVFKTLGKYLPPPTGARSPALWGTRARLTELFGSEASSIKAEPRSFNFRYRSPEHFLDVFKTFYGPVLKAFAALEPTKRKSFKTICTL